MAQLLTTPLLTLSILTLAFIVWPKWKDRTIQKKWYRIQHKRSQRRITRKFNTELPKLEQLAIQLAREERFHPAFTSLSAEYILLDDKKLKEKFDLWIAFTRNLCYDAADWREQEMSTDEIRQKLRERVANRDASLEGLNTELRAFNHEEAMKAIQGFPT